MPVRALIIVVVVAVSTAVSSGGARAEKVKTNQTTKVYARPGEQAEVVVKVKSGQNMTVLAKDGRWLKVRVQGRTGYVPRSKVDGADTDEIERNTRRRPFVDGRTTHRGFGGDAGPEDRVGADATGAGQDDDSGGDDSDSKRDDDKPRHRSSKGDDDDKPKRHTKSKDDDDKPKRHGKSKDDDDDAKVSDDSKDDSKDSDDDAPKDDDRQVAHVGEKTKIYTDRDSDSDAVFTAKPNMILYPTETKGKWTLVEDDEGDAGWVLTSHLDIESPGGAHKRELDLGARLGFTFISQGMRAVGSTAMTGSGFNPDNYNIGVSSLAIALGGRALYPYGKDYLLGGEFAYSYSFTALGGVFVPSGAMGGGGVNTSISIHNINVRGLAGYDLHKSNGMMVFGRLGYRYQGFLIADVADPAKNPAKFPSEVLKAPTLGAGLSIPRLTDKIGLKFALDAIVAGASINQTVGLEDGKPGAASAKAVCLGGEFVYKWKKDMDLRGTYDLNYAAIDFGPSVAGNMRGHTGTDVSRTDIFHTVTFGIAKGF